MRDETKVLILNWFYYILVDCIFSALVVIAIIDERYVVFLVRHNWPSIFIGTSFWV